MNRFALLEKIGLHHALFSAVVFAPFLLATLKFWGPWFEQHYGATVLDLALALIIAPIPMLADWCENLGFLTQLLYFPEAAPVAGALTLIATKIKLFALMAVQGGFVVALAVFLLIKFLRKI